MPNEADKMTALKMMTETYATISSRVLQGLLSGSFPASTSTEADIASLVHKVDTITQKQMARLHELQKKVTE